MPAGNISLMLCSGEMVCHNIAFVLENAGEVTVGGI